MERLDKIVSKGYGVSRSDARRLILKGMVLVDGTVVRDIAFKTDPMGSEILVDGQAINYKKHLYLIMNKPEGLLSATEDKRQKTVLDIIPESLFRKDLFPIGRLDKNTTGLLLITNDGDFAHTLLSPNKKIPKQYLVTLDAEVPDSLISEFKKGVTLKDGTKLSSAGLIINQNKKTALVTITEGKYHQIKRMFGVFGLGVEALKRVSFAGVELPKDLNEGQVRELTKHEHECINMAKYCVK